MPRVPKETLILMGQTSKITRFALLAAFLVGLLAAAPQAHAQTVSKIIPIRVKLGILTPNDGNTRNFAGSPLFSGEIDIAAPNPSGLSKTFFTVGYSERSDNGNRFRVIPITISQIFSPPNPAGSVTGNLYGGLGIGYYMLRASGGGDSASKNQIGGFAVTGYQFPNSFFIETKYHVVGGSAGGAKAGGLAFYLGRKF